MTLLLPVALVAALVLWMCRPDPAPRGRITDGCRSGPSARRAASVAVGVSGVYAAIAFPLLGMALIATLAVRAVRRRSVEARRRSREVERTLPDTIDLIALMVGSGVTARQAIGMAAPRFPAPHRGVWANVLTRADAGEPFSDAIGLLVDELGEPVRPLTVALRASMRDGVALGPALARCSDEAHRRRQVRAEEAARRVPVLMLFPLVCCVLPAFVLLTIVPLLAGSISDLRLPT